MLAMDHIVIASKDPEKDALEFEKKHNIKTIRGGKHTNWGTFNHLAYFNNNSYIEWLGVFDETLARKSDLPLVKTFMNSYEQGEFGPLTFALRTANMEHNLREFKKNGVSFLEPFPGARKKPDGSTLTWRMLFTEQRDLPFLIEWGNGINLPNDKALINPQELSTVIIPSTIDSYRNTFQLPVKEHEMELENGKLLFMENTQLDFEITNAS